MQPQISWRMVGHQNSKFMLWLFSTFKPIYSFLLLQHHKQQLTVINIVAMLKWSGEWQEHKGETSGHRGPSEKGQHQLQKVRHLLPWATDDTIVVCTIFFNKTILNSNFKHLNVLLESSIKHEMCVFNELQSTHGSQLSWFLLWMPQGLSLYKSLKHYIKPVDKKKRNNFAVQCVT